MKMLAFRAKEKDLIRGKMLQECKCISKRFNDEVDFFNSPQRARLLSFYPTLVFLDLVDTIHLSPEDTFFQSLVKRFNSRQNNAEMLVAFQDVLTMK
jgi:hypothetical protein